MDSRGGKRRKTSDSKSNWKKPPGKKEPNNGSSKTGKRPNEKNKRNEKVPKQPQGGQKPAGGAEPFEIFGAGCSEKTTETEDD